MRNNNSKDNSKIYVTHIIKEHIKTFRHPKTNSLTRRDKFTFIWAPILFSFILSLTLGKPSDKMIDVLNVSLSVFVGLFLNLLVLILSILNKDTEKTTDKKGRKNLIKETFTNISFTIILGLIALGFVLLSTWRPFSENLTLDIIKLNLKLDYNCIYGNTISFILYSFIVELILTLLMVIKRIYSLFKVEIEESE